MLKGTRDGILKKIQPISIHGQVSWDVYFTDLDDPEPVPQAPPDRTDWPAFRQPGASGEGGTYSPRP